MLYPTSATGNAPFNQNVLTRLVNMIYGSAGDAETLIASLSSQLGESGAITATDLRNKTYNKSSGQSIVVRLGGLDWIVTYVSNDTDGNLTATLWLSNNHQEAWEGITHQNIGEYCAIVKGGLYSDWSADWVDSSTSAYPSNMYGTSYIRVETLNNPNGRRYATSYRGLTSAGSQVTSLLSNGSGHPFALYTVSFYGLTNYLTTPNKMSWIKNLQDPSLRGTQTSYNLNNESLSGSGTYYSSDSDSYNYTQNSSYGAWHSDYLFLPSMVETGYSGDSAGLWQTNTAERTTFNGSATSFSISSSIGTANESFETIVFPSSWSRSAYYSSAFGSYHLKSSGSDFYTDLVDSSHAVRPTLFLTLNSAASHAAKPAEAVTITLNREGGSGGPMKLSVAQGDPMPTLTSPPTKSGYAFGGYYTAASGGGSQIYRADGTPAKQVSTFTANTTLYAYWLPISTITLDNQGATTAGEARVSATYGSAMPGIIVPKKAGYTFGGYYIGINGSGTQYYTSSGMSARTCDLTGATTLYAKWTANTYTVTLDNQGATTAGSASVDATYGSAMPSITPPTKTDYTFVGYYTATNGGGNKIYDADGTPAIPASTFTTATTLYAYWIIQYELTLEANIPEAVGVLTGGGSYKSGSSIKLTAYPEVGYYLSHWLKDGVEFDNNKTSTITVTVDADATYTAVFEEAGKKINSVAVMATRGGVARVLGDDIDSLMDTDEIIIAVDLVADGYRFVGWYDYNDMNTLLYTDMSVKILKTDAVGKIFVAVFAPINNSNLNLDTNN